jgi:hypothetical protein
VDLAGLHVFGANGAGLHVNRDAVDSIVNAADAVLDGNVTGVVLEAGDLTLRAPKVRGSQGDGIFASVAMLNTIKLTVEDGVIHHNGGIGLETQYASRLHLNRTRICANEGATVSLSGTDRKVGGLYASGTAPADLNFTGNRFHENKGDQAVFFAGGSWNLDAPNACDSQRNAFALYDSAASGVGVVAAGTAVSARYSQWSTVPPVQNVDYVLLNAGSLNATNPCLVDPLLDLTCPAYP